MARDTKFVVQFSGVPEIPVLGEERTFPVRRIWCVGRNYAAHAREMGHDPQRELPFFFAKPADAVVTTGGPLNYPPETSDLHHEVELAVAIGRRGLNVDPEAAKSLIYGYAIALDMTRRDIQAEAKKASRPWALAKGFDQSCPISPIQPVSKCGLLSSGAIHLDVNGQVRQHGDLSEMVWSVEECLSVLSRFVELMPGDILLTGTPAGVAAVGPGDKLRASVDEVGELRVQYK